MRKRNMKFMAMFLSLTMVFSMNTFAFGSEASLDEIPGEAVQAEAAEGEEPEVVKIVSYEYGKNGYHLVHNCNANGVIIPNEYKLLDPDFKNLGIFTKGVEFNDVFYLGEDANGNDAFYPVDALYEEIPVLTLCPALFGNYEQGVIDGEDDSQTDINNGDKKKYEEKVAEFAKEDNNDTIAYKAGYYDGYAGKGHNEFFQALTDGYNLGYGAVDFGDKDSVSKVKDTAAYKEPSKVKEYVTIFQDAFEAGVRAANAAMSTIAYNRGYRYLDEDGTYLGALHMEYTTLDKYLATDEYKQVKENYKDYVDGYFTKYEEGMAAGYEYKAKTEGYNAGRDAGKLDGECNLKKPSDVAKDDLAKYLTDVVVTATDKDGNPYGGDYEDNWHLYKKDYEVNDKGHQKNLGEAVGETYLNKFVEGYDAAFAIAKKNREKNILKTAYCEGFARGYAVGTVDGQNNNKKADTEDREKDASAYVGGTTYHAYTETNKMSDTNPNGNTDDQITQYTAGYNFGYEVATTTKAYNDGYDKGYESGKSDGLRDQYLEDMWGDPVDYRGYWEHDYPNSPYNIFKDSDSQYAKGYIAGYDDGYNAIIGQNKVEKELRDINNKGFDYTSADMDAWRASTDPVKWETSQLLINENAPAVENDKYKNYFFDTRQFDRDRTIQFKDKAAGVANAIGGQIVATSPFQYYFDLNEKDHLVDKKTVSSGVVLNDFDVYEGDFGINEGSIGRFVYAAYSASGNKPKKAKKGVSNNATNYVIVRYRLAGSETDENYKVRRYTFDANGNESVVIDNINNYYQGTDKNGNVVNEPVVPYDSRKIAGVKENKDGTLANNDKANRYIINAEALLISWEPGSPAKLLGEVPLKINAKDNVNATVPHDYISFLGDTVVLQEAMFNPNGYTDDAPVILRQTDKPVDGSLRRTADSVFNGFSKYYAVTKENSDGNNAKKGEMGVVTFKGAQSAAKLAAPSKNGIDFAGSNAFMNKKGASPTFTLKAGKLDPKVKAFSKDIKMALKNATLSFEISRMKIASDYVSTMGTIWRDGVGNAPIVDNNYTPQDVSFTYEDTVLASKLASMYPVAPKRSECSSLEDYQQKVKEYKEKLDKYNDYIGSDEFEKLARAEFQKAVEAYRAEYKAVVDKYGSKLDYMQKWIEDTNVGWLAGQIGDNITFVGSPVVAIAANTFPYTVTKDNRTDVTGTAPVGRNELYRKIVPEDADCDGIITAIEHYEYVVLRPNWPDGVDDPRFNGKLEAGDNIENYNHRLIEGDVKFDEVAAAPVVANDEITGVRFDYRYYDVNGDLSPLVVGDVTIATDYHGKYYYGDTDGADNRVFRITALIDFFDDQQTDIGIIEDGHDPVVVWPGAERTATITGQNDTVDIDFEKPVIKWSKKKSASGNSATMAVKAILHTGVFVAAEAGVGAHLDEVKKNLKVDAPKPDKNGIITIKKLPKADLQLISKMAETEPFVVVTGINNYEGSIAIRQRNNGDLGYGYFKDDDFYYIFSDED